MCQDPNLTAGVGRLGDAQRKYKVDACDHICVCICTYKRPALLGHLLSELEDQATEELFTYSVVVVDNDHAQSAKDTVMFFREKSEIAVYYYCEPEQNISLARNMAVQNAQGNLLAFIDDDEAPMNDWLLNLYQIFCKFGADGVFGPVKPHFEEEPPEWIKKGKICERKSYETGTILKNHKRTRTGNVLLAKDLFDCQENSFDPDFGRTGGEDVDFFERKIQEGRIFVHCNEAPVYETVPPERFERLYFLRRALLRGAVNSYNRSLNTCSIVKSTIAVTLYTSALPLLFIMGHHLFMRYLIKDCDHVGKLLGLCGFKVVRQRNF